ncbi:MAG TPA: 2-dehydropantoate 2-reductase [Bordetella sp.]
MKVCVYGLGAVGGLIAGKLRSAGVDVCAVARGRVLEHVNRAGLALTSAGHTEHASLRVAENPAALGAQDLVVIAVKATGIGDVARRIAPLLGEHTVVLSAMNGVPWWFYHGIREVGPGRRIETVDPAGAISAAIAPERVVGCVSNLSASTPAPGEVAYLPSPRLTIGEPGGGAASPRCRAIIEMLQASGFTVLASESIQQSIWFKLWGNMTVNPISALTGATGDRIVGDPLVRAFMSRCMVEARVLGERIGLPIDSTPDARHEVTARLGAFRTSMLQDVQAGKATELDALVGAVRELARHEGVETPDIDALFGLARLQAQTLGLYPRLDANPAGA